MMRPMMEEYMQQDTPPQNTRPPQGVQRPQSHYDQNVKLFYKNQINIFH
jgi:hypothetical protein